MSALDWAGMFGFSRPWLELVIRGTALYWFLVLVFRMVLRREIGALGISDMLLLVLIADASQNAMAGQYRSVTDGLILVSTLVGWNTAFDYLAFRFPHLQRLLEPAPLVLVKDGRMLRRHMRREFITEDELRSKLRSKGVDDVTEVKLAQLENDGDISVIKRKGSD